MNSDRDGIRGGWATPGDDQSDAESAVETTGEFTIDYAPPAWYTQNASSPADDPAPPTSTPAPPHPGTGSCRAHAAAPAPAGRSAARPSRSAARQRLPAGLAAVSALSCLAARAGLSGPSGPYGPSRGTAGRGRGRGQRRCHQRRHDADLRGGAEAGLRGARRRPAHGCRRRRLAVGFR
ncbi:SCO5717 family growth-regulating ATPase [Streptomyces mexicanus]|uniref:SCO5717 family growth-regulating ATPase n=1 Tax=Streptomyces mexicanus TaxID=178566 RepID=UPI003B008B9F